MEKVGASVEAIESEAETALKTAREQAGEILLEAREKARKIAASKLPLDGVRAETQEIVHRASEEAAKQVAAARREAADLVISDQTLAETVDRIAKIVTGAQVE